MASRSDRVWVDNSHTRKAERAAYQRYCEYKRSRGETPAGVGAWLASRYDRALNGLTKAVKLPVPDLDPIEEQILKDDDAANP